MVLEKTNVTDEVINGSPKYTISANGDGTNSITLANQVIQQGTPLNKYVFNKIDKAINDADNVIAYKIPTFTKSPTGTIERTITQNIIVEDVTPTWNINEYIGNTISGNMTSFDGITPTYEIETDIANGFQSFDSQMTDYSWVISKYNNTTYRTSDYFKNNLQRTSYSSSYYLSLHGDNNADTYISIVFDMKVKSKIDIRHRGSDGSSSNVLVQGSNDKINWTTYYTIPDSQSDRTITSPDFYRYHRLYLVTGVFNAWTLYYLYISGITYLQTAYNTNFEFDNDLSDIAQNQIVLANIGSNYDSLGVTSNSINGIDIDTLLIANKYYELLYNSLTNKFIAQEMRN